MKTMQSERLKHSSPCGCKKPLIEQIKTYLPFLKKLRKASKTEQIKIIKKAPACFLKFITECSGAILRKDIELPKQGYKSLKKYTDILLYLNNKRHSLKRKHSAFNSKHGGFLPFLPLLAGVLAPIFGKLIAEHI